MARKPASRQAARRRTPPRKQRRSLRRWLLMLFAAGVAFGAIALGAMYASIASGFTPPAQLIGAKGIQIYDRNGQLLFAFGDEPGSSRIMGLEEISPFLIDATIATEDADFWQNPGVNYRGVLRAAYENLAFWQHGGFFKGSGGSSLSQQLAKNLYIRPEERLQRSPLRKLKETMVAFELTRRYSKQQILEWYLGNIYYGNGVYGIESASSRYFSKPPSQLTLAEAALLAGIPRGPSLYDPIVNLERAMDRQRQVLDLMLRHGVIDQAQHETALLAPVALREGRSPVSKGVASNLAPHFSLYVRDQVTALLGADRVEENLRVITTLDSGLQAKAETILTSNLDRFEGQYGASNGALVAMDPLTGEVLAMAGSHDFFRDDISGQVNNAVALNQPGSTMKPITYASAFAKGWSPSTIVVDEPKTIANGGQSSYVLNNADLRYRGAVPVRTALGSSLNVPAVKALEYAGLPTVYALAKKMGLSDLGELSNYGLSFTLGAADASLLDMTYAYSVFANRGEQAGMASVLGGKTDARALDPVTILQIERANGEVIWKVKPRKERLLAANLVYLLTNVLSDDAARVSLFGANSPLNLPGRRAAVKSGLSDDARDAWVIGYTPQLVAGVWIGNANNQPMVGGTSTLTAAPVWRAFMMAALEGSPPQDFAVPEGIQFVNVCAETGAVPAPTCAGPPVSEPFLSNRLPLGAMLTARPSPTLASPPPPPRLQTLTPTATTTPRAGATLLLPATATPTPTRTVLPPAATPTRTPTRTLTPAP